MPPIQNVIRSPFHRPSLKIPNAVDLSVNGHLKKIPEPCSIKCEEPFEGSQMIEMQKIRRGMSWVGGQRRADLRCVLYTSLSRDTSGFSASGKSFAVPGGIEMAGQPRQIYFWLLRNRTCGVSNERGQKKFSLYLFLFLASIIVHVQLLTLKYGLLASETGLDALLY